MGSFFMKGALKMWWMHLSDISIHLFVFKTVEILMS